MVENKCVLSKILTFSLTLHTDGGQQWPITLKGKTCCIYGNLKVDCINKVLIIYTIDRRRPEISKKNSQLSDQYQSEDVWVKILTKYLWQIQRLPNNPYIVTFAIFIPKLKCPSLQLIYPP